MTRDQLARSSVLFVCGLYTDARVWGPVIHLLGDDVDVEEVDWPHDLPPDVVAAVDSALPPGYVYDLVVGAAEGDAGAIEAARLGTARRLMLIGPSGGPGMPEVDFDFDFDSEVPEILDGLGPEMELVVEAMQSGDTATYARLMADQIGAQIGEEHHAVIESMISEYAPRMDSEGSWLPPVHPWADWLPGLAVPITLVFNDTAAVAGSLAQRNAQALLARCLDGESTTVPYVNAAFIGLGLPASVVALIENALA